VNVILGEFGHLLGVMWSRRNQIFLAAISGQKILIGQKLLARVAQ